MKKTKSFDRTIFSVGAISTALNELGDDRKLYLSNVKEGADSVSYDSESDFLEAYKRGRVSGYIVVHAAKASMTIWVSEVGTAVEVEASDEKEIDLLLSAFERVAAESRLPEMAEPIELERYCVPAPLHWETLPLLPAHLRDRGITIQTQSIRLIRYPDTIEFTKWEDSLSNVRNRGESNRYSISLMGTGKAGKFALRIQRGRYVDDDEPFLKLSFSGLADIPVVDDVVAFLGLTADTPAPSVKRPERSAFIAHHFDQEGEQAADRLARFLQLLGFDVKTGRAFAPEPVSEKVRKRMATQAVVFVVLTPAEDSTWLTQESILGYAKDKPLFILRDSRVQFKAAMLGDLEYIPFDAPGIESTFIPILEGLKELAYLDFR